VNDGNNEKIACKICGAAVHSIQLHLKKDHADSEWTFEKYQKSFPGSPILSSTAIAALEAEKAKKAAAAVAAPKVEMAAGSALASVTPISAPATMKHFHELFELGNVPAAMSTKGNPIQVTVLSAHAVQQLVPPLDKNHVYDIEILKNAVMALELNMPYYGWGHKGSGKTTTLEQIASRTNRPLLRVQHTINTEESHIIGHWTVKGGETVFMPGPLSLAMRHGWIYLADEYDVGLPSVLAVYQPVMEGKSLVIKEAQGTEWAIVKPHPNFRFWATGNTNGSGDETGLYQGTQIQNSANYDRFGVVQQYHYMKAELETQAIANQAKIAKADAAKLVDFANRVRTAYDGNEISDTISPRTLINAAKLGMLRGSWRVGLQLAFINKLSKVDRETVDGVAQRVFG
jgi:cobaltochelatase CobS